MEVKWKSEVLELTQKLTPVCAKFYLCITRISILQRFKFYQDEKEESFSNKKVNKLVETFLVKIRTKTGDLQTFGQFSHTFGHFVYFFRKRSVPKTGRSN